MKNKDYTPAEPEAYIVRAPVVHHLNEIDLSGKYSYANYLKWEFDERVELIKGKIFKMSPAPAPIHQHVLVYLTVKIYPCLPKKSCELFVAPFDVRFPDRSKQDKDIYTVVQPDLCIICDPAKIDAKGCLGAPDITIEILSPGTQKKDLKIKHRLYEEFGVKEYWIVDPGKRLFIKYVLTEDLVYGQAILYEAASVFTSDALPGFELKVADAFT